MRVTVKKWRNSAVVCIPAALMDAAKVRHDDEVDVREEGGRIIIEPVRRNRYSLARLLAGITRRNLHAESDFRAAVGNELLCDTPSSIDDKRVDSLRRQRRP
jgi:antitoxin MazE